MLQYLVNLISKLFNIFCVKKYYKFYANYKFAKLSIHDDGEKGGWFLYIQIHINKKVHVMSVFF